MNIEERLGSDKFVNELHHLAWTGEVDDIEKSIEALPEVINYKTSSGLTPLMIAAARGEPDVVECLLEHGAKIDVWDKCEQTAIGFSVNQDCNRLLIEASKSDDPLVHSPLHQAVISGNLAKLKKALQADNLDLNGVNPFGETPLMVAARNNLWLVAQKLIEAGADPRLMHRAYTKHRARGIIELYKAEEFVKQYVDKPYHTTTPLHQAALNGDVDALEQIAGYGTVSLNIKDGLGNTAIYSAVKGQQKEAFNWLLDNGVKYGLGGQNRDVLEYALHLRAKKRISEQFFKFVRSKVGFQASWMTRFVGGFKKLIKDASEKAERENKPLLVLLGEQHEETKINQLKRNAYKAASALGISVVFDEFKPKGYEPRYAEHHAHEEFDMELCPVDERNDRVNRYERAIDPELETGSDNESDPHYDLDLRNQAMMDSISKVNRTGIFSVGRDHFLGLYELFKKQQNYLVLPVNISSSAFQKQNDKFDKFAYDDTRVIQVNTNGICSKSNQPLNSWNRLTRGS